MTDLNLRCAAKLKADLWPLGVKGSYVTATAGHAFAKLVLGGGDVIMAYQRSQQLFHSVLSARIPHTLHILLSLE